MTRRDLIGELLRQEDIEGLLSMGAPGDEYESEVEMIANRISEAEEKAPEHRLTREEVENIIASVWKEMFELSDEDVKQRQAPFAAIAAQLVR
jgi:cell division ATPase FtsA